MRAAAIVISAVVLLGTITAVAVIVRTALRRGRRGD